MEYTIQYVCGHGGTVNLTGTRKEREWRQSCLTAELCPDCAAVEREKKNKEAAAKAKAEGYPNLTGSEKQVGWAETIRLRKMEELAQYKEQAKDPEVFKRVMLFIASHKTRAAWWIDNATMPARYILQKCAEAMFELEREQIIPEEVKTEATLRPEKEVTKTIADIKVCEDKLIIFFPEKREDFRLLMRKFGFKWNERWELEINFKTGSVADRAAEIGNILLNKGYTITIADEEIRQNAITGKFKQQSSGWIMAAENKKSQRKFASISWRQDHDFYAAAKRLPGARYSSVLKAIMVPIENYEDIIEFAEANDFEISPAAKKDIENARKMNLKTLLVKAEKPKTKEYSDIPNKLVVPKEVKIDESLCDQD